MKRQLSVGVTTVGLLGALCIAMPAHAAPGQVIVLDVNGPSTNAGKVKRCQDVARRHGFNLAGDAPIRVTLSLMSGYNRLVVTSSRRGPVLDTPRPGWGMEQLCEDAMQAAERAYGAEGQPPGMAPSAPPPQYGYQPPPVYAPQPQYAPAPVNGSMTIALDVTGPASNPGKAQRCYNVATRRGVVINPGAPLRVTLLLQNGANRLQITSARRGPIYDQMKPPWGMEQLCEDAISNAQALWGQEGGAPPPSYQQAPPPGYGNAPPPQQPTKPGYALGPIPPSKELAPAVRALVDGGVQAWGKAQFDAALVAFREALRVSNGEPQFLFDQAVCEQRLGRFAEALSHTQQFLDKAPQSPYRPYAEQLFSELQASMGNE